MIVFFIEVHEEQINHVSFALDVLCGRPINSVGKAIYIIIYIPQIKHFICYVLQIYCINLVVGYLCYRCPLLNYFEIGPHFQVPDCGIEDEYGEMKGT
jgi:hypothetical protein